MRWDFGSSGGTAKNRRGRIGVVASLLGVAAGEPTECFDPNAAVMRAEALSRKEGHVGAVAFSRTGDPATGDFSDAQVIRKFGDVPDDLSTLWRVRITLMLTTMLHWPRLVVAAQDDLERVVGQHRAAFVQYSF
jgi:hypothetical protein